MAIRRKRIQELVDTLLRENGVHQPPVPLRVGAREAACVRLGPDRCDRVDQLDLLNRRRRDEVELRLGPLADEDLRQLLELDVRVWKRARPQPRADV